MLLRKCGEEELKANQNWMVKGDLRNKVCDKLVVGMLHISIVHSSFKTSLDA